MLKQEVLGYLHSKAKWYAINHIKNVAFRLDVDSESDAEQPKKEKKEKVERNLGDDFDVDCPGADKARSTVQGEKFGRKHPVVSVSDLTIEQFWPFVASEMWEDCSSLRVTDGILLDQLNETLESLLKRNMVYKYTTRLYDRVLVDTTKSCYAGANLSRSAATPQSPKRKPETIREEVTATRFVYYGTSLEHLMALLRADGHDDVTLADVTRENRRHLGGSGRRRKELLEALCQAGKPPIEVTLRASQIRAGPARDEDDGDFAADRFGRKRLLYHRKLSGSHRVEWPALVKSGLRDPVNNVDATILSDARKRQKLREINARDADFRTRLSFHDYLERRYGETKDAHEFWWYNHIAQDSALREPTRRLSAEPSAGAGKRSGGGRSSRGKKPASAGAGKTEKEPSKPPLPTLAALTSITLPTPTADQKAGKGGGAEQSFFAEGARNKSNADGWQCLCEMCTGALLPRHDSRLALRQERALKSEGAGAENDDSWLVRRPKTDSTRLRRRSSARRSSRALHSKKRSLYDADGNKKGKDDGKKSTGGRSRKDGQIWWESVSEYTTPYWQAGEKEKHIYYKEFLEVEDIPGFLHGKRLNLSYSKDQMEQGKRKGSLTEEQRKLVEAKSAMAEKFLPLDFETLKENGVLFSYNTDTRKQYTKLQLKPKPLKKQIFNAATSLQVSYDKSPTPAATASRRGSNRRAGPPTTAKRSSLTADQRRMRHGSSNVSAPEDAMALIKETIPSTTGEQKCEAFFNTAYSYSQSSSGEDESEEDWLRHFDSRDIERSVIFGGESNTRSRPTDLNELCLAALRYFVVRSETVMVSGDGGFHNVNSLTVNRHPAVAFPQNFDITRRRLSTVPVPLAPSTSTLDLSTVLARPSAPASQLTCDAL